MQETAETARQRILVALDVPTLAEALALVEALRGRVGGFKVGLELCTSAGVPQVVQAIAQAGGRVFLDLKLKDIPHTVAATVASIVGTLGPHVQMLTLHCDGSSAMLVAAATAVRDAAARHSLAQPPLLVGVTALTSLDAASLKQLGIAESFDAYVLRMTNLAHTAGLGGVVASPHEVARIKQRYGDSLLTITPGIRPVWAAAGDQRRVCTPAEAVEKGADYLVIGRPVTAAPAEIGGPAAAAERIVRELAAG